MSSKNKNTFIVKRIPPQGQRKKSIVISVTFSEPDKDIEDELNNRILKIVFKNKP